MSWRAVVAFRAVVILPTRPRARFWPHNCDSASISGVWSWGASVLLLRRLSRSEGDGKFLPGTPRTPTSGLS
eukprot:4058128-Lingulodinium_polyedra.AAC.1